MYNNTLRIVTIIFHFIVILKVEAQETEKDYDFVIAFGSCNKQYEQQPLWDDIVKQQPNLFIWGGDNIYSDTDDMSKMQTDYQQQKNNPDYAKLSKSTPVIGVWDDHDYGKNDAGTEWKMKAQSQQLFLDFFDVPNDDVRRSRAGTYSAKVYEIPKGSIKVILLDTRYFRSPLQKSDDPHKRYEPLKDPEATVLGKVQWEWLTKEIENNYSDFIILVSSIQFLSSEHGYETWGNFPLEQERLIQLLQRTKARNAIILSGDRHISEFSSAKIKGLPYSLIDFTSSGMTHSYTTYSGESNRYRVGKVITKSSFGVLKFDLDTYQVLMEMRGEGNVLLQEYSKQYPK